MKWWRNLMCALGFHYWERHYMEHECTNCGDSETIFYDGEG